jgi:hypothetical protein
VRDQDVTPQLIDALKSKRIGYVPTLTRDLSVFVYETRPSFFDDPFFLRGAAVYRPEMTALSEPAQQERVRNDRQAQSIKAALQQALKNLKALSDAGVTIAMGTDSGTAGNPGRWQGYFEHVELEYMVRALQYVRCTPWPSALCRGGSGVDRIRGIGLNRFAVAPKADVQR